MGRDFPPVQTSSGAHPASYTMGGYRALPGGKVWPRRAANYSLPSSAEVMEEYSYTSTHPLGHNKACNGDTLPLPFSVKNWQNFKDNQTQYKKKCINMTSICQMLNVQVFWAYNSPTRSNNKMNHKVYRIPAHTTFVIISMQHS